MKKSLWIIALLFVVIGTPNAHATSFTPTFTCFGVCDGGTPTAPDVSFPAPTTITETWDGFTLTIALDAFALPSDSYTFGNTALADSPTTYTYLFEIVDNTAFTTYGSIATNESVVPTALAPLDSGTLSFSGGGGTTPEPSTWVYAITGVGFLGLLLIKLKAL